jgi:uncharacterized protein
MMKSGLVPSAGNIIQELGMKKLVQIALRGYKWAISPLFPPSCRYTPTCSEYALEAVERYGALRGSAMAVRRLLGCHPLARGGFDPVPTVMVPHICAADVGRDHRSADNTLISLQKSRRDD